MPGLTLVIGNKNYSSWSMRPWVAMKQLGIPFDEVKLRFHSKEWDAQIARWSPSRLVPVLWRGDQSVWDSLAILEALHEWFPDRGVWPGDPLARAFARSVAAEMHSGFRDLRANMPMNIRAALPGKGMKPEVQANVDRIQALWGEARRRFGHAGPEAVERGAGPEAVERGAGPEAVERGAGPFLFGAFCAADAMYAPVVMRFATYGVKLAPEASAYCEAMRAAAGVRAWIDDALRETEIVPEDEPYATAAT